MQKYKDIIRIMWVFCVRDYFVHVKSLVADCVNYGILWPITFGFSFTVLRKNLLFSTAIVDQYFGSMVLVGSIVVPMMVIAWKVTFDLMFDLESRKYVSFQLMMLNPTLFLCQRILFATAYTFFISMLFFPAAKLFLQHHFIIKNAAWGQLTLFVLLSSVAMCALQQACAVVLTIPRLELFWVRFNYVLMTMSGAFMPTSSLLSIPVVGQILFLNPVLHMTEGVRGILYPGSTFIPITICALYLVGTTVICTGLCLILFKKRVDHI